ncbi:MAG: hypothetical protein AAGE80_12105 [Pseudomonadota bacterium]
MQRREQRSRSGLGLVHKTVDDGFEPKPPKMLQSVDFTNSSIAQKSLGDGKGYVEYCPEQDLHKSATVRKPIAKRGVGNAGLKIVAADPARVN